MDILGKQTTSSKGKGSTPAPERRVYKMNNIMEPGHEKMCLMSYANNKGADQPAHPRSLISAFVVRCLDSIISLDSIAEISTLASFCGCAGRFVSGLVGNSRRHILS